MCVCVWTGQVADLDDDFAELLLGQYSENFDAVPAGKVRIYSFSVHVLHVSFSFGSDTLGY